MREERIIRLAISLIALVPIIAFADDVPDPVGLRGDPARLQFTGALPTSADRLRYLLAGDPDTVEAAEPERPMAEYLSTIDRRLREAMWANGYPRPSVDIDPSTVAGQIIVKLDSGKRVHRGAIDITGDVAGFDVESLRHRLTTVAPPFRFNFTVDASRVLLTSEVVDTKPGTAWDAQAWASFYPPVVNAMANSVEAALAERGHLHARAKADVDNDGVLHVSITYLSPLVAIRQIKVTDATRNTAEAVIRLAGLHVGDAIDLQKLEDAQQRLWESGRFNTHSISVDSPPNGDPKLADVTIDVQENQGPLIDESFSPAEQILLKSRRWLTGLNTSADELAFDWSSKGQKSNDRLAARFVTGGHTGVEAGFQLFTSAERPTIDLQVIATPSMILVATPSRNLLWDRSGLSAVVTASLGIESQTSGNNHLKVVAAAGMQILKSKPETPALQFDYHVTPAAAVNLAHMPGWTFKLDRDRLVISDKNQPDKHLKAELSATNGALLNIKAASDAPSVSAGFVTNKVEQDLTALQSNASMLRVSLATIAFLPLVDDGSEPERAEASARAMNEVLTDEAFSPLIVPWPTVTDDFSLAVPNIQSNPAMTIAAAARPYVDQLWARNSWPWTLCQFLFSYATGRSTDRWPTVFTSLTANGPIACLSSAEVFDRLSHDAAKRFAQLGLEKLDDAAFAADVRAVLSPGSGMAQCCDRLVANLRRLSPQQVEDLLAAVRAPWRPRARIIVTALRANPAPSGSAAVSEVLATAWPWGLRDAVRSELQRLANAH